jgi:hypothetical protein
MKATQFLACASIALLTTSFSCDKEKNDIQPCQETTPVAFTAQRGEAKTYVISSAAELSASVQCASATLPSVDFATHTLLAGRVPRTGGAVLRSQSVAQDCRGNYVYTLNIADGPTLSPTDVDYATLVPRAEGSRQVRVVVNNVP